MLSVRDTFEFDNKIPEYLYASMPKVCEYCKSAIVLNDNLTLMKCSNPKCVGHGAFKASSMFQKLKVKNFGEMTCRKLMISTGITNHLKLLTLSKEQFPKYMSKERIDTLFNAIQIDKELDLPFILELYQLSGVSRKTSEKIIGDFDSFSEFYSKYPDANSLAEHIKRSMRRKKITRPLMKMAIKLWKAKEDLIEIEPFFVIKKRAKIKIPICMTGEITSVRIGGKPIKPRSKFVQLMNKKYENIITFINSEDSVSGSKFLLVDRTTGKKKLEYARRNNIQILTFAEFMTMVEQTVGTGDEEIDMNWRK